MNAPDAVTADEIDTLRSKAVRCLRLANDRDKARSLATEAEQMLARLSDSPDAEADIYAGLAGLWRDLGDHQRAETLIKKAIERDALAEKSRPLIHGTHHFFIAKLLFEQKRFAEAAKYARDGLALYEQGVEPGNRELAYQRQLLEPVLRAGEGEPS